MRQSLVMRPSSRVAPITRPGSGDSELAAWELQHSRLGLEQREFPGLVLRKSSDQPWSCGVLQPLDGKEKPAVSGRVESSGLSYRAMPLVAEWPSRSKLD